MRAMIAIGYLLFIWLGTAHSADDATAVREQSTRYAAMVLGSDKEGLRSLLHDNYQGWLPGELSYKRNAAEAVAYYHSKPTARFKHFKTSIEGVRVFGQTAIERGAMTGERPINQENTAFYGGVSYLRVWLKVQNTWRLVDEQYH